MAGPARAILNNDQRSALNAGSAIAAYLGVKKTATDDEGVALVAASTDTFYGVVMEGGLPAAGWGDIQIRGRAKVTSGGAFSANDKLMVNAAGKFILFVAAAGNHIAAIAMRAASGTDLVVEAELVGPGVFFTT